MNNTAVETKEKELNQELSSVTTFAEGLVIDSEDSMLEGRDYLRTIKDLKGKMLETFDPVVSAANKAHKEAVAAKKMHVDPLDAATAVIKRKVGTYLDECEKKRAEEEAE